MSYTWGQFRGYASLIPWDNYAEIIMVDGVWNFIEKSSFQRLKIKGIKIYIYIRGIGILEQYVEWGEPIDVYQIWQFKEYNEDRYK